MQRGNPLDATHAHLADAMLSVRDAIDTLGLDPQATVELVRSIQDAQDRLSALSRLQRDGDHDRDTEPQRP